MRKKKNEHYEKDGFIVGVTSDGRSFNPRWGDVNMAVSKHEHDFEYQIIAGKNKTAYNTLFILGNSTLISTCKTCGKQTNEMVIGGYVYGQDDG